MFRRSFLAALTSAALVTATASPVAAIDQREGRAEATAISFAAFGQEPLTLTIGASDAAVGPTELSAAATALSLLGEGASVTLTSGSERDPAEGDGCQTPDVPVDGLDIGLGCTVAEGDVADPSATATATLAGVSLNGDLVPALVDALLVPIEEQVLAALDEAAGQVAGATGTVTQPVIEQLQPACFQALEAITGPATDGIGPVIDQINDNLPGELSGPAETISDSFVQNAEQLPGACAALFDLVLTPPSIADLSAEIRGLLADALADRDLLALTVGDSTSTVGPDGADWAADAQAATVTLTLPSLADLVGILEGISIELVEGVIDEVAGTVLGLEGIAVPALADVIDPVLEALPIALPDLLTSTDPLLTLQVLPGVASVSVPTGGGTAVRSADAALVRATVAEALGELFGQDELEVSVSPGDSVTLFEGTPLESTLASGDVEEFDETSGSITLAGVRTAAADLALFTGLEGGVEIVAGAVEAAAGVGSFTAGGPDPEGELPVTGGGAALAGLALLGSAAALRRRR
ncbi:MAG: hypothetical protein ACLGIR_07875 [Actinomycetes bacterium]